MNNEIDNPLTSADLAILELLALNIGILDIDQDPANE